MNTSPIKLFFSPCPNDTFIFCAIAEGRIDLEGLSFEIAMEDVETLNHRALKGEAHMIKVSYHAWYYLQRSYVLLESGSAMGKGVGPLLIARRMMTEVELREAVIALPGEYTTAHLLFRLAYPQLRKKKFMVFSAIGEAVIKGDADAGVIIHENRFTYQDKGLVKIADLGEWWEKTTGAMIPLGGIVARRDLGDETVAKLNRIMHNSVDWAMKHPEEVMPFVRRHAQEMEDAVMKQHIALYVNEFTLQSGPEGRRAVEEMTRRMSMPELRSNVDEVMREALRQGLIRQEDTVVMFYDLDFLEKRIRYLQSCFPPGTLHALAIKACPLTRIMELTRELGCGVEAASLGEVILALRAGFEPSMIVYDSPVKTFSELEFALNAGVGINIDNLTELNRIKKILERQQTASRIGIRINPQVGVGTILESSVAGTYSKFGVPIRYRREELKEAFLENGWLTGVHLHVGSQGCPTGLLSKGVEVIAEFASEVNNLIILRKGTQQITHFDIGGGLPVSYQAGKEAPLMHEYANMLKDFLDPRMKLITEFGRWAYTNAGWTVSRVEYIKQDPGINTAMIHAGADLFVRECLNPSDWQHEYTLLGPDGQIKYGTSENPWNLAGPLCFSGDILARGVPLPEAAEGDYLVIHDTGSYTFSMWSRYNSRFTPRIIGYRGNEFRILKERETEEQLRRFWE